ncbi:MAG TPA: hypothetical protein VG013_30805, partial [Gemmataceae bacterium]|nr:hypothetical protein [Gemmataceae bacterium]
MTFQRLAPVLESLPAKTMPPLAAEVTVVVGPPSPQSIVAVYSVAESLAVPVVVRLPGSVKVATVTVPVETASGILVSVKSVLLRTTAGSVMLLWAVWVLPVAGVSTPSWLTLTVMGKLPS